MDKELQTQLASFLVDVLLLQQTIVFKSAEIQWVKENVLKAAIAAENHFLSIEQVADRAELRHMLKVCQEEIQMAHYWLRILQEAELGDALKTNLLVAKAFHLKTQLEGLATLSSKRLLSTQSAAA